MIGRIRLRGMTTLAEARALAEGVESVAAAVFGPYFEFSRMHLLRIFHDGDLCDYANKMKRSKRGRNRREQVDMHYLMAVDVTPPRTHRRR
jgi:hypothetical protein